MEKSSKDVRKEDRECILLMPKRLGLFRIRDGPGSLSTVAKDIEETRLRLCTSEEDIEWSSSNSLRLALATRTEGFLHSIRSGGDNSGSGCMAYLPAAAP